MRDAETLRETGACAGFFIDARLARRSMKFTEKLLKKFAVCYTGALVVFQ
jgi:hypothetical protein